MQGFTLVPLRVQVPNNHILSQNLLPKTQYLIIGYLDPLGTDILHEASFLWCCVVAKAPELAQLTKLRGSKYPIIRHLGFCVIEIIVQILGEYMIIRYLVP